MDENIRLQVTRYRPDKDRVPGWQEYDVPLDPGDAAGDPDVTIVISATDICLVAARRLAPAAATVAVDGDVELADLVLAATDAFARD